MILCQAIKSTVSHVYVSIPDFNYNDIPASWLHMCFCLEVLQDQNAVRGF